MQIQTNTSLPLAQVEHNQLQAPSLLPNAVRDLAKTGDATLQTSQGNLNVGLSDQVQAAALKAFEEQLSQLLSNPGPSDQTPVEALDTLQQRGLQPAEGGLTVRITGKGLGGVKPYAHLEERVFRLQREVNQLADELRSNKRNYENAVKCFNGAISRGASPATISQYESIKNDYLGRGVDLRLAIANSKEALADAKAVLEIAIEMDKD